MQVDVCDSDGYDRRACAEVFLKVAEFLKSNGCKQLTIGKNEEGEVKNV